MLEKVKINGYEYWVSLSKRKLYLCESGEGETDFKFLTRNERNQMEMWLFYAGKPMINF